MSSFASGCPSCGADRLKSAPVMALESLVRLVSEKRRYRCAGCGWTGWRRRLIRRKRDVPSLNQKRTATPPAVIFFIFVVAFLLVSGVFLVRGCSTRPQGATESIGF